MRWQRYEPQHDESSDEPQHEAGDAPSDEARDAPSDEARDAPSDEAGETTDAGHSTGNSLETPLTGLSGGGATHGAEGIVVGVELSKRWA
jgi:hypothetical protein